MKRLIPAFLLLSSLLPAEASDAVDSARKTIDQILQRPDEVVGYFRENRRVITVRVAGELELDKQISMTQRADGSLLVSVWVAEGESLEAQFRKSGDPASSALPAGQVRLKKWVVDTATTKKVKPTERVNKNETVG